MHNALIGYTGFVGGNLLRQKDFQDLYNSRNIETVAGRQYDLLVCAGAPAEKWRANQNPEADLAGIQRLQDALADVRADRVILISTVDVYPEPRAVDEETEIDPGDGHAYGRHRLLLERFIAERFDTLVIRLPGLFGTGLKKNVVYDFLHNNEVEKVSSRGVFQFYRLDTLWPDVEIALHAGLRLVNFATEPVRVDAVAREAFGFEFHNETPPEPKPYDVRSRHAGLFGGVDGYLQSRERVLSELAAFVRSERGES